MLPSINAQYGTSRKQTGLYTKRDYAEQKQAVQLFVKRQVLDARWITDSDDRYQVAYAFRFSHELKQDLDGPIKGMTDCLIPWAIYNDNRILQMKLDKFHAPDDLTASITITCYPSSLFVYS